MPIFFYTKALMIVVVSCLKHSFSNSPRIICLLSRCRKLETSYPLHIYLYSLEGWGLALVQRIVYYVSVPLKWMKLVEDNLVNGFPIRVSEIMYAIYNVSTEVSALCTCRFCAGTIFFLIKPSFCNEDNFQIVFV